ncbi:hypothetical protein D039_2498, partial [Vibrio parahaemolyticus EKP-028]
VQLAAEMMVSSS